MQRPYELVTSADRLGHIANEIASGSWVAVDFETTPKPQYRKRPWAALSPFYGRARLLSINTGRGVYVVDLFQTGGLGPIKDALHNPEAHTGMGRPVVIGHNIKFDQRYFRHEFGVDLWPVFCTYRASAILHNGRKLSHDLWSVQRRELQLDPRTEDLGGSDWSGALEPEQIDYAADDVIVLPAIRDSLKPKLAAAGLNRVALIEFGAILPEVVVELNGFPLDPEAWNTLAGGIRQRRDVLARELLQEIPNPSGQLALPGATDWMFGPDVLSDWAGEAVELFDDYADLDEARHARAQEEVRAQLRRAMKPKGAKSKVHFNLDSNAQLLQALRKLDPSNKAMVEMKDTSEATLATFAAKHPTFKKLIEYRGEATRAKSFGPEYITNLSPETGRIHTDYYPLLVTGRYAHRNPNLGQIPRDKAFRLCFRPRKGRRFTIADYCLVPGTKVLCADLRWVPIETLSVGDEVVGFDEALSGSACKLRRTKVERVARIKRPVYRIVTTRGTVVASDEHKWVCTPVAAPRGERRRQWVTSRDLKVGDKLAYLCEPWEEDRSWEAGYLAGIFDGEGWVSETGGRVGLGQKQGPTWDRIRRLLRDKGYDFGEHVDAHGMGKLWVRGEWAGLRLLGSVRPRRLVDKGGMAWEGKTTWGRASRPAIITDIEYLGEEEVVAVRTGTHTLIAEGFLSHNSNVEMVIMAELTGDPVLVRLFNEGVDVHYHTASKFTGKPVSQITKAERQQAKPANFGFIYGLGAEKFVSYALVGYGVVLTLEQAVDFRIKFFEEFAGIADWQQETLARGTRTRISRSIGGRIRYLDETAYNENYNNPDQSTGADGLKMALRNVYFRFRKHFGDEVKMVHHVHDEIVSEHEDNEELARLVRHEKEEGMKEAMSTFIKKVPVKVEAHTGESWADK